MLNKQEKNFYLLQDTIYSKDNLRYWVGDSKEAWQVLLRLIEYEKKNKKNLQKFLK